MPLDQEAPHHVSSDEAKHTAPEPLPRDPNRLLTEEQAAIVLDVKNPQTLAVWRSNKRYAIPYIKIGRNVRYRLGDLQDWMNSRTYESSVASE